MSQARVCGDVLSRSTGHSLEKRVGGDATVTVLSRSTLPGSMKQGRDRGKALYSSSLEVKVVEDGAWRRTRLPSLWMRWLQLADLPSAVVACSHPTESENGALR